MSDLVCQEEGYLSTFDPQATVELLYTTPNDVIIIRYDVDRMGAKELNELFDSIAKSVKNPVVAIPKDIELMAENKEDLIKTSNLMNAERKIKKVIEYLNEEHENSECWLNTTNLYGIEQDIKKAEETECLIRNIKEGVFKLLEVEE